MRVSASFAVYAVSCGAFQHEELRTAVVATAPEQANVKGSEYWEQASYGSSVSVLWLPHVEFSVAGHLLRYCLGHLTLLKG